MRNIVNDQRFLNERTEMMQYFQDKYYQPEETEIVISPSGSYKLEIHHFHHEEEIRRYSYTKGIIKDKEDHLVDVIYRNFSFFIYQWVQTEDDEYLLCGLDYQGYTIVDLIRRETCHFVPETAYDGQGFCWGEIFYLRDKELLVIDGCYWASPYELVFYDFAQPKQLPHKELFRVEVDSIKNWGSWITDGFIRYRDEEELEKKFTF